MSLHVFVARGLPCVYSAGGQVFEALRPVGLKTALVLLVIPAEAGIQRCPGHSFFTPLSRSRQE